MALTVPSLPLSQSGPSLVGSFPSALGSILESVTASLRWVFGLVWFCGDEDRLTIYSSA